MAAKKKNKKGGIDGVIEDLNKVYGVDTIFRLDSDFVHQVEAISTGSLDLDIALGVGGLPRGRVVEIYGDEGYGKTSLALSTMAQAQQQGDWVGFIDMEHAIDPKWVVKNGVNMRKAYLTQPDGGEEALNIALALVRSGEFGVVVIDSVAALLPKVEEEADMGAKHMALQARLMGQALRKMMPSVGRTNTLVIFTNQLRYKMGVTFGDPTVTPGGKALKFWSSVRVHVMSKYKAQVKKNKVAAPFKRGVFTIHEDYGVDAVDCACKAGLELEVVTKSGAYYYFSDVKGQGWKRFVEAVREDPASFEELQDKIRKVLGWEEQPRVVLIGKQTPVVRKKVTTGMWDTPVDLDDKGDESIIEGVSTLVIPDTAEVAYEENKWNTPAELVALMKDAGTLEVSGSWVRAFGESYQGWTNLIRAMEESPRLYLLGEKVYLESIGVIQETDNYE